jgi:hypothetical protein
VRAREGREKERGFVFCFFRGWVFFCCTSFFFGKKREKKERDFDSLLSLFSLPFSVSTLLLSSSSPMPTRARRGAAGADESDGDKQVCFLFGPLVGIGLSEEAKKREIIVDDFNLFLSLARSSLSRAFSVRLSYPQSTRLSSLSSASKEIKRKRPKKTD